MDVKVVASGGAPVAVVRSGGVLITDGQSALDFMAAVCHETGCLAIAVDKGAFSEEFFDLSTRIAGEALQKFSNYRVRLAVYGDFSGYASKALRDFIYESNRGKNIFFVSSEQEAVAKLSGEG